MKFPSQIYNKYKNLNIESFINEQNIKNNEDNFNKQNNWQLIYKSSTSYINKLKKVGTQFWVFLILFVFIFCIFLISTSIWLYLENTNQYFHTILWGFIFVFIPLLVSFILSVVVFVYYRVLIIPKALIKLYEWKTLLEQYRNYFKDDEIAKQQYPDAIKLLFWNDEFYQIKPKFSSYHILHMTKESYDDKTIPYWYRILLVFSSYWNLSVIYSRTLAICVGLEIYIFINKFIKYVLECQNKNNT